MNRKPRTQPSHKVDALVPMDIDSMPDDGCFNGKYFDITTSACAGCADRLPCHMKHRKYIDSKANDIEKKIGSQFLDKADFDFDIGKFTNEISSGETTVQELIKLVQVYAQCDDRVACKEWIKRWVRNDKVIKVKEGIVWVN